MPSATYYQPIEKILNGKCKYEYYNQSNNTFSMNSKSRICHVILDDESAYNKDVILMIFTIRNQSNKENSYVWKIHSEGPKRMDPGATVPLRNKAIQLSNENGWKYFSLAVVGDYAPEDDVVTEYVISMESYEYGNETVFELTDSLKKIEELGKPDFYRAEFSFNGKTYPFSFIKKERLIEYLSYFDSRPFGNFDKNSTDISRNDNDYAKFKGLIKFFVDQLNINNDIIPGDKRYGMGFKDGSSLRPLYSKYRDYGSFTLDCRIRAEMPHSPVANYITKTGTSLNVNPRFDDTNRVSSLTLTNYGNPVEGFTKEYRVDDLSLDSDVINENIKQLFNDYLRMIEKYDTREDIEKSKELFGSEIDKEYTIDELGAILAKMYNAASSKVAGIHMFGIKFGGIIVEKDYSISKIIKASGINDSYTTELAKGVSIYKSINSNEFGIHFADEKDVEAGTSNYNGEPYDYKIVSGVIGENRVVYGTPGCGKSYYVKNTILKEGQNIEGAFNKVYRTTFFQDYSNTDFVGQIVPTVQHEIVDGKDTSVVTYSFVPGPFTKALEYAIANPTEKVALVIEELNRGNAPSIFGDLFQLLDRTHDGNNGYPIGTSEYGIVNVSLLNYLKDNDPRHYNKECKYLFNLDEIRIPANLYLYATMNTSDQNVFTLDTAFKRRWDFEKLKNVFDSNHEFAHFLIPGMKDVTWKEFVDSINSFIINDKDLLTSEDKQLGVYFVDKTMLCDPSVTYSESVIADKVKAFAYKVFEYLWNDVAKFARDTWFVGVNSLDQLIENYSEGKQVFNSDIFKQ